ncbi:MAG: aspartate carbamoyltransferase catalytic subunit [Erysipelotrichaceae bacterium]|nr:aspartate carbamoyltransferase catalytic subunit [Erysipelotrichaceae bacterium]
MKHLLQLSTLTKEEIMNILQDAIRLEQGEGLDSAKGKIVANLFFEPSTRTQYSFQVAEEKLGCKVISFNAAASSLQKGESFYDTVKTFESFGIDAVVIRSRQDEYYKDLVGKIQIPILNAGDGVKDHPTQSLLDLMTIYQEFGKFEGLKIAIVGDIKYSRVAHTNIEVMERLGMKCYISGPEEYRDEQYEYVNFDQAIEEMDIIMLLRVQHERHEQEMSISKEEYHKLYGLTMERVHRMKEHAIIMHPAPFNRNVEIADDVVECDKSRIFKQIHNGVYVRMAVIRRAFGG